MIEISIMKLVVWAVFMAAGFAVLGFAFGIIWQASREDRANEQSQYKVEVIK